MEISCFCCYTIKRTQHTSMTLFVLPREVQVEQARASTWCGEPARDTCSAVVDDPIRLRVGGCRTWWGRRPPRRVGGRPLGRAGPLLRCGRPGPRSSADRLLRSAETTPFDSKICPLRTGASSSDLGSRRTSNSSVGMLHARNRKGCLGQTGTLLPKG